MKKSKSFLIMSIVLISLTFSVGCSSRSTDVNNVDGDVVDRLPKDQKDTEIDKILAQIRKARKESTTTQNGSTTSFMDTGSNLPNQSKNIPKFDDIDDTKVRVKVVNDYLENHLKIPKDKDSDYDIAPCLDPRMNAIYDDEDKGVANGYDNENIYLAEYETENEGVYSYLILVRESKDSLWKVIHNGTSYKK